MARSLLIFFVAVFLVGCGKSRSVVGSWRVEPDTTSAIWTFNPDDTWMVEAPAMMTTMIGKYRLDGDSLAIQPKKELLGPKTQDEQYPAKEFIIKWKNDNEFVATSHDDLGGALEIHYVRLSTEETARMRTAQSAAQNQANAQSPKVNGGQDPPALPKLDPAKTEAATCASNLKQLSTGMLLYSQDYDEQMPLASSWADSMKPYLKNEALVTCPTVAKQGKQYGYGFNINLSAGRMKDFPNPAQRVMLFESTNLVLNASDNGSSVPKPGRHEGANNYGFLDGHVAAIK